MPAKKFSLLVLLVAWGLFIWTLPTQAAAIAEKGATKVITAVKPGGTVFYVIPDLTPGKHEKGKIKIRAYRPECMPDTPAYKFVAERLRKKMPLAQTLDEALEAQLDPCDVIRAAIMLGVKVEDLYKSFRKVCQVYPEYQQICTPCLILKCTLEALRCLKEVEVTEGEYGVLLEKLAPVLGEIKPEDMDTIIKLLTTGVEGPLPGFTLTPEQMAQAKLTQEAQQIKTDLINAGASEAELQSCMEALDLEPPREVPSSPPPPAAGAGGGGGGPVTPPTPPVSPSQ